MAVVYRFNASQSHRHSRHWVSRFPAHLPFVKETMQMTIEFKWLCSDTSEVPWRAAGAAAFWTENIKRITVAEQSELMELHFTCKLPKQYTPQCQQCRLCDPETSSMIHSYIRVQGNTQISIYSYCKFIYSILNTYSERFIGLNTHSNRKTY